MTAFELAAWTEETVHAECHDAYNQYSRDLDDHYARYFAAHPAERGAHERQAIDLVRALPPGWERLADQLPARVRHVHSLSGRSSQVLAVAILGAGANLDPSLAWLFTALSPLPPTGSALAPPCFEYELPTEALNEEPRVTSLDWLVQTDRLVICAEAKRGEAGFGRCSCSPSAPKVAACSTKVLERPLYWQTAYQLFGTPERAPGRYCPVSLGYQAIRSVAAARYLARGGRQPVFALIYDADNPYFGGAGAWPGWPQILEHALRRHDDEICFRAISWQRLLPLLPIDAGLRSWLLEKHRLQ